MNVRAIVTRYYESVRDEGGHSRHKSWEHCFRFFSPEGLKLANRDQAALQLGFYLASWGMYRGSGFILNHDYTIHDGAIEVMLSKKYASLWEKEFGAFHDLETCAKIADLGDEIRESYREYGRATDTLVTKIMLGTIGCLPAIDRYFVVGFKEAGLKPSTLSPQFITEVSAFCRDHLKDFRFLQSQIEKQSKLRYPLMKLVDMYVWQLGCDAESKKAETPS